jgi:hypothetical protein
MAAKLTRLTYKVTIQLHQVAESCTICSSRSRRPVRKLLDTLPYGNRVYHMLGLALDGRGIWRVTDKERKLAAGWCVTTSFVPLLNKLTPWSWVLLEKLIVTQPVKKFPTFYGTRWFITVFTTACVGPCHHGMGSGWRRQPPHMETTANIPNKQSWTAEKGWSSTLLVVGREAKNSSP